MKKYNAQAGFTLIEMAFVILILGLIVGSVFAFMSPQLDMKRIQTTAAKENQIAKALADYALRQGRLPCPAPSTPYASMGLPVAYNVTTAPHGTCTSAADRDGTVPYKVLGLTQDDATDSYGNPISYIVSPELTSALSNQTYRNYRTATWRPSGTNINSKKAIMCGQRFSNIAQQLEVYNDPNSLTNANHVTSIQEDNATTIPNSDFDDPNNSGTAQTGKFLAYFAYVLVSHGKNGEGAYTFSTPTWTSPTGRRTFTSVASKTDKINADSDREFVVWPRSSASDDSAVPQYYFDDIVLWRTQEGMIRDVGDTCARP